MTPEKRVWTVRLTAAAEADFQDILHWTAQRFGRSQARAYAKTLSEAIEALTGGPTLPGAKARSDIARGFFTLHVARNRRQGRHFVMFRIARDRKARAIEVLRLIHDAMDLPRHLPPDSDEM